MAPDDKCSGCEAKLKRCRGRLFLSESRRNLGQPVSIWIWSKVVRAIAKRADANGFSTHTMRHLCLTDLARADWDIHEIATFAGHRNIETTMIYIHLSARDLAAKFTGNDGPSPPTASRTNEGAVSVNENISPEWSWPIHREAYDSTADLSEEEISSLTGEPVERINYSGPRWPALLPVRRLIEPLEDVFLYIDVAKHKRDQLMPILLREIGKRHVSFWGWTDQDWLDVAAAHRYFTGWIIAAAFLLCDFRSLYSLPKGSHVFSSLAKRVFGNHRLDVINAQIQKELEALGYKRKTRRLVPITVSHLLLSVHSPRVEDISIDAFATFEKPIRTLPAKTVLLLSPEHSL